MRVLIIDDDRALRDALRRALGLAGYEVDTAADGETGLARIAALAPDAVVLDIGLPNVDGVEACRRLRRGGDRVPVLMLTARDAVEDRIDGLDAGADDYLVKPFDVGELKARLRALLRRVTPRRRGNRRAGVRGAQPRSRPPRPRGRGPVRGADAHGIPVARVAAARTRRACSPTRSAMAGCGATTSVLRPTRCASTSAICSASWSRRARDR